MKELCNYHTLFTLLHRVSKVSDIIVIAPLQKKWILIALQISLSLFQFAINTLIMTVILLIGSAVVAQRAAYYSDYHCDYINCHLIGACAVSYIVCCITSLNWRYGCPPVLNFYPNQFIWCLDTHMILDFSCNRSSTVHKAQKCQSLSKQ